jgi:diketogulonate reductase-like aldo/keto reductase
MIDLYKERKVKAIGVSNFTIRHLQELHDHYDVVPMVNQVEFHPFIYEQQRELLLYCHDNHIVVEAYSPLSRISKSGNPVAERIAEKHHVSVAQVFLRWCLQHRTVPLPRSVNPEHIKDNLNVFDFELDEDDIDKLNRLSDGERVTWDPADMH